MNSIDKAFFTLVDEIRSLDEKELYYRMRKSFDAVPEAAKRGLMTSFPSIPIGESWISTAANTKKSRLSNKRFFIISMILPGSIINWPITGQKRRCMPL